MQHSLLRLQQQQLLQPRRPAAVYRGGSVVVAAAAARTPQQQKQQQQQNSSGRVRLDPAALTWHIKHARSTAQLLRLHRTHRRDLDAVHVSALLTKLAWVTPAPGSSAHQHYQAHPELQEATTQLLKALLKDAARAVPQMQPRALSSTLWALSKLQPLRRQPLQRQPLRRQPLQRQPLLLQALLHRAHAQLGLRCFAPRQLCDVAHALAALQPVPTPWISTDGATPGSCWDRRLLAELFGALGSDMQSCNAQDAAQAVLALARLSHAPGVAWLQLWLLRAHQLLPHFGPQGLANAAYGLVKALQLQGLVEDTTSQGQQQQRSVHEQQLLAAARAWLQACLRVAVGHIGQLEPRELIGQLLWAAARLSCGVPEPARHHLVIAAQTMLPACDARHLSMALYVFAQLGVTNPQHHQQQWPGMVLFLAADDSSSNSSSSWLDVFWTMLGPQVPNLAPQELAQLLWAMAQLQLQAPLEVQQYLRRRAYRHVQHFDSPSPPRPREAITVLRALAVLGWAPRPAYVRRLRGALLPRLPQFAPQDFANCLWALATVRAQVESRWLDQVLLAAADSLPAFSAQELSNTLWALARLGHSPAKPLLQQLQLASLQQLPHYAAADHASTLWALARLGFTPSPLWLAAFWSHSGQRLRDDAFSAGELHALVLAAARLQLQPPTEWLTAAAAAVESRLPEFYSGQLLEALQALNALWRSCQHSSSSSNVVAFSPQRGSSPSLAPSDSSDSSRGAVVSLRSSSSGSSSSGQSMSAATQRRDGRRGMLQQQGGLQQLEGVGADAYSMACLVLLMPHDVRTRVDHWPRLLAAELQQQRAAAV